LDNQLQELVSQEIELFQAVKKEISKIIIGQDYMVDRILIGLLTGGHILIEGVPGLAKSLTVHTISRVIGSSFKRIQFTPDLLPADIIGTEIYHQKTADFVIKKGPVFHNIILADEINRAPAKVQSALLEAMQEKQVTIGDNTYQLEEPFLVLATQNPLEQEGTYPLPEAQQDRFMMKLKVTYPSKEEEKAIVSKVIENISFNDVAMDILMNKDKILSLRQLIRKIHIDTRLVDYLLDIVFKTRESSNYIQCGVSPRASINLVLASQAKAFLEGRSYVVPDDIKSVIFDVLRHRLILTYEAEAENKTVESVILDILENTRLL
jgi:MoxR-like ATPase